MELMKKTSKQNELSKALNYIRAYVPTSDIAEVVGVKRDTVNTIARGQSQSTEETRRKIFELEAKTKAQVAKRQADFLAIANDKTKSANTRSLARLRAQDLGKVHFTPEQASKRQTIIKEQTLPNISASEFLSHYSEGKTDKQLSDELDRFTERGQELRVSRVGGNVIFSRKPLYKSSLVHVRGIVYVNNFDDYINKKGQFKEGINQIVRDLVGRLFQANQTLTNAINQGEDYFHTCFKGVNNLEVNEKILNHGIEQPKKKEGDKRRSRAEKYESMADKLIERIFLGVYLY